MGRGTKKAASLAREVQALYCIEDFEEWLDEMRDPSTQKVARLRICEGLTALGITHDAHGDYGYYKAHIHNHILKTKRIISFGELEDKLLLLLFEAWSGEDNAKLRETISRRLPDAKMTPAEYYKECFIYYVDDISRLGNTSYELWFTDEARMVDRLTRLLGDDADGKTDQITAFVRYLLTVDGLMPCTEKYILGDASRISRNMLIWLASVHVVANFECFGTKNHKSLPDVMSSMSSSELTSAGYAPKNFDNCLDVYLAFSAYRYMRAMEK